MPTFDTPSPVHARIDISGGSLRVRAATAPTPWSRCTQPTRGAPPTSRRPTRPGSSSPTDACGRLAPRPRLLFFGAMPSVDVDLRVPVGSGRRSRHRRRTSTARAGSATSGSTPVRRHPDRAGRRGTRRDHGRGHLGDRCRRGRGRPAPPTAPSASARPAGTCGWTPRAGTSPWSAPWPRSRRPPSTARSASTRPAADPWTSPRSYGEVEAGIPAGTAAYLDLHTQFGTVHHRLDTAGRPSPASRASRSAPAIRTATSSSAALTLEEIPVPITTDPAITAPACASPSATTSCSTAST